MVAMGKQKKPKQDEQGKKKDLEQYRKPRRLAGIPEKMAKQIDILVKRNGSDFTEEVRIAVRERLERSGLWPVDDPKSD